MNRNLLIRQPYKLRGLGGYTPRVFTSLPGREAKERLSGFIMTNKQTNKRMRARRWRLKSQERKEKDSWTGGFTSPEREAKKGFSGIITTNKWTNKLHVNLIPTLWTNFKFTVIGVQLWWHLSVTATFLERHFLIKLNCPRFLVKVCIC